MSFIFGLIVGFSSFAIVGGSDVSSNDPIAHSTVGLSMGCTGTLIAEDIVLTAAHCISNRPFSIVFGTNFQNSERVPVKNVIRHPGYKGTNAGTSPENPADRPVHDIAIVQMTKAAPQGFIPVSVDPIFEIKEQDPVVLAGFGQTNPQTGAGFGKLRMVNTLINFFNTEALEIVFGATPGKSACRGDSGGPMYIRQNGQLIVIGVTSRGFQSLGPCSGNGNYTDVQAHMNWIEDTINGLD